MSNPADVLTDRFLLFGRNKKQPPQSATAPAAPAKLKPKKLTGLKVAKYEVADDKVAFSNLKGLSKKRWVIEKEYPIYEITAVETDRNWLSLKWNDQTSQFRLKRKDESFAKLKEQILAMQSERQKTLELNQRAAQRKTDLLGLIDRSLPIVDTSFDILIGLHAKRVDWRQIEACTKELGTSFSYKPVTLPSLDLDFAAVDLAVKSQVAKDMSNEAFAVLKAVHSYFTSLKQDDDLAGFNPNFGHVKAAVLAYYTLNDLLLAKVVSQKDSGKEVAYLEALLKSFEGTNVKIDMAAVLAAVNGATAGFEGSGAFFEVRALFKEQLRQL